MSDDELNDGAHSKSAWRELTSVVVTPLDESYSGTATVFHLTDAKPLAVSPEDGEKIKALIAGDRLSGRTLVLSPFDGVRIRVSITQ